MASLADPRSARPRAPVQNAPDVRTLRTSETLIRRVVLAAQPAPAKSETVVQTLFDTLQARYG